MESAHGNTVPPFLSKTYDMVDDPSTNSVVSWSSSDNSFVVWKLPEFQKELLPKYFKHNNFSSFVRQLNTYGFRKVDPDRFEFANEGFLRGQKHILKTISRKKPLHIQGNQSPLVQGSKVTACIEVGKFGLEEDVEGLKRDKNVLMQELVRLRQKQQDTDNQLQTVGQRVQVMEQRQQQMMSFLAKAMQNPGFLDQFVQQKNENNRHIGGSKKRRLPGQEEENSVGKVPSNSPEGQIVKFHSSMNEAHKAMLHQILKTNSSSRLEPSINNSGPFLLDNLPSSGALDSSTSSRISELMLPEVQPTSESSLFTVESGFSVNHPSSAISEVHSSSCLVIDHVKTDQIADMKVHNSGQDTFLSNSLLREGFVPGSSIEIPGVKIDHVKTDQIADMKVHNSGQDTILSNPLLTEGFVPGSSIEIPGVNFVISNALNADNVNPTTSVLDVAMPVETDAFSSNQDMDILVDGNPNLPGINDSFWEQFLSTSQLTGDTDEISSSSPETHMTREQELQSWPENGWDNIQCMNHLTEQMELLASESRRG